MPEPGHQTIDEAAGGVHQTVCEPETGGGARGDHHHHQDGSSQQHVGGQCGWEVGSLQEERRWLRWLWS